MAYFIRTEERPEDAEQALKRGRSIRRWAFAGCSPWEHLAFALPVSEQLTALEAYGYDIDADEFDLDEAIHIDLFQDSDDDRLVAILNLEPCEHGGYAEFLPGLCALEAFDEEPAPGQCAETLNGELFALLVCYEGEQVGHDPDEGWPLFKPRRIVWMHETGSTMSRWIEIG